MNDNQFDEFFRNKLQEHSSPVPGDMWQRIQQKEGDDRKLFFFWRRYFMLLGFLIVCGAGIYFLAGHRTDRLAPVGPHPRANRSTAAVAIGEVAGAGREKPGTVGEAAGDAKPGRVLDRRYATGWGKGLESLASGRKERGFEDHLARSADEGDDPDDLADLHDRAYPSAGGYVLVVKDRFMAFGLSAIPGPPNTLTDAGIERALKKGLPIKEDSPGPKKKNTALRNRKWYLDLYGSPDRPFNKLTAPDSAYASRRAQKMEWSYTVGLRLTRTFGPHFSGTIGFQYSKINEKLGLPAPNGLGVFHLAIRSLDIPLLIGYRFGDESSFMTKVNAGILFNANSRYEYTYQRISRDYTQNGSVNAYLGFNLARRVSDKMLLFSEPYFKYQLSGTRDVFNPYAQRIMVAGLSVGVRYEPGKNRR